MVLSTILLLRYFSLIRKCHLSLSDNISINFCLQVNKTLPLNYDFEFVVEEITNINDKGTHIDRP